jgi:predicted transglutaminase-like cysteine proteinase
MEALLILNLAFALFIGASANAASVDYIPNTGSVQSVISIADRSTQVSPQSAALHTVDTVLVPRLPAAAPQTAAGNHGVFRSVAISAARLPAAAKWQDARQTDYVGLFGADCAASGLTGCDTRFARSMHGVADKVTGMSDSAMLDVVNRSVNSALTYRDDRAVWGVNDYWATPEEMARKGAGDCEDFAIAKYWLLRSLGVPDDRLQLVILQDTRRQLFHAVLVAHMDTGAYVLDNVSNRLQLDTAYGQYQPIMSFAGSRSFIHGFAGGNKAVAAMPKDLSAVAPGVGM